MPFKMMHELVTFYLVTFNAATSPVVFQARTFRPSSSLNFSSWHFHQTFQLLSQLHLCAGDICNSSNISAVISFSNISAVISAGDICRSNLSVAFSMVELSLFIKVHRHFGR